MIDHLRVQESGYCPYGYTRVGGGGLNGDLNQDAGGEDIFICMRKRRNVPSYVQGAYVSESSNCPEGYSRTQEVGLNGDLNQGAGGKDIFLCYSNTVGGSPLYHLQLSQGACPDRYERAPKQDSLNGDLNQDAGGKDIFLCLSRDPSEATK